MSHTHLPPACHHACSAIPRGDIDRMTSLTTCSPPPPPPPCKFPTTCLPASFFPGAGAGGWGLGGQTGHRNIDLTHLQLPHHTRTHMPDIVDTLPHYLYTVTFVCSDYPALFPYRSLLLLFCLAFLPTSQPPTGEKSGTILLPTPDRRVLCVCMGR